MGYRSDVRAILPEEAFNIMDAKLRALKDCFCDYHIKQYRTDPTNEQGQTPKKYVYFGWDAVKWYESCDGYEDVSIVMDAIHESDDCHFIRIGEDYADVEEIYNLQNCVQSINHCREFNDNSDNEPCPHCTKLFNNTTLVYSNGSILVNTSIDFCPKCGKKMGEGKNCA